MRMLLMLLLLMLLIVGLVFTATIPARSEINTQRYNIINTYLSSHPNDKEFKIKLRECMKDNYISYYEFDNLRYEMEYVATRSIKKEIDNKLENFTN